MSAGIIASFKAPPASGFSEPDLARIVFFHLPEAIACSLFLFAGAYFSIRYLMDRDLNWDIRAAVCQHMTMVLGVLTLITGILFSRMQWGAWWGWDPRQTSFLLVMLIIGAYFALRSGFTDERKRATVAAAYELASLMPILFLLFVYPRLPSTVSLHPETKLTTTFDPTYKVVYWSIFLMVMGVSIWIYRLSVRASLIEAKIEELHGQLDDRDGSAVTGVVRPVSVPADGG